MDSRRLGLIVALLVFANLVLTPTGVLASCAVTPDLSTAISDASAVFVGTVTSVDHAGRVANVHVEDIWKGNVAADVQVVGTPDLNAAATSVDRYYADGTKYLFIPFSGSRDSFQDNSCSLTQPYSASLASFRPMDAFGRPPTIATSPSPASRSSSWAPFVLGGLLLLALMMLAGIALRRRRGSRMAAQ